jgi:hypothetical protein
MRPGSAFFPLTAAHWRPGPGLEVQRAEFIDAEDDLRLAGRDPQHERTLDLASRSVIL